MNLAYLRPLYARAGPWASGYLDASTDTADARQRIDLAARAVAEELAAAGADPATCGAVQAAVADHTGTGRHGLAVFATGGEVVLAQPFAPPPPRPFGRWSARPFVAPLVTRAHEHVRWLRALVDRTGGDLVLDGGRTLRTVSGGGYPIHQAQPGGWSQPRYQRAARTNWERNAKEVARALADAVDETGAEIVVLAGDVRARQLLAEHLPDRLADRVVQTDAGARAPGADPEPLDEATERAVRERVGQRYAAVLDRYRAGRAHALAVAGPAAVGTPLEWGQVDTLLLNPGVPEDAADPLIAGAVGADAEVMLIDADQELLPGGVGAVLRYPLLPGEDPEGRTGPN
jgi:hypothetical protein